MKYEGNAGHQNQGKSTTHHYKKLLAMAVLSFVCMYILMYSMVDSFRNVFPNANQFYMAGLMTMPMVIIELLVMSNMYVNKKANAVIIGCSLVSLLGFYIVIRQQAAINDRQFLKSMIPHHAGAILMCEEANIHDPEIKRLCASIKESQQKEINEMKSKLAELKERD